MTRKEQIIEVLQKHIFADGDIWVIYDLKKMYDDLLPILALPLEVPSDEELIKMEEDYGEKHNEDRFSYSTYGITSTAFNQGAIWMRDEIIKRNK